MEKSTNIINKENKERREFLIKSLSLLSIAGFGPALFESCEFEWAKPVLVDNVTIKTALTDDELFQFRRNFGLHRYFPNVNYGIPVIIVRLKDTGAADDFTTFSSLCTHDSCNGIKVDLQPKKTEKKIICACHGSEFDAKNHGKVIKGPAEKALKEFPTSWDSSSNTLTINF